MRVTNHAAYYESAITGAAPAIKEGTDAPDTGTFFTAEPIGTVYLRKVTGGAERYTKVKDDGTANDWIGIGWIADTFTYDEMTDGGSTAGTFVMTGDIPAGSLFLRSYVVDVTGFAGDSSATIQVGDGSDVDRYSVGTPSVFANVGIVVTNPASGVEEHTSAVTSPTVTITSGTDFGAVSAGQATVILEYSIVG